MAVWSDRQEIEGWLRLMANAGDPVAAIRLSVMLYADGLQAEVADVRRQAAEECGDNSEIMIMLGEALQHAELVDREPAILRHLQNPAYDEELKHCGLNTASRGKVAAEGVKATRGLARMSRLSQGG
jgi:hypothetical protein